MAARTKGLNSITYPLPPAQYDPQWASQLIELLRINDNATPQSPAITGISVTNYTRTTTFNKSTDSTDDFINFACTIIDALKDAGYIG